MILWLQLHYSLKLGLGLRIFLLVDVGLSQREMRLRRIRRLPHDCL